MLILAESAADKAPFYVLAGLLVLWAVGLAALGLRSPTFPGSERGGRVLMAATIVLALGTMIVGAST